MLMQECRTTFEDTAMLKQQRIRSYMIQYRLQTCPFQTVLVVAWLMIEKTSFEDVEAKYECFGEYLVSNPHLSTLTEKKTLILNPGTAFAEYDSTVIQTDSLFLSLSLPLHPFLLCLDLNTHACTHTHAHTLVYPLLEVIPMDRPQIESDTYHPEPDETLQWNCSVQAGLGDTLVWRLNGENLHHVDMDNPISTQVSYIV